jgi:uncharacterized membrane-anchored protein|tara:strand:- start:6163 stop:6927 length:765 start_codon:yes stop_codon:yes gene_type:complete
MMTTIQNSKVPEIIALYWVIKIAATTLGETGADLFSMTLNIGYDFTIALFLSLFALSLYFKLKQAQYTPVLYWLTFTTSAIAGTAISDYIDRTLGFGYLLGSVLLVAILLIILSLWYLKERSLSVDKITSPRVEIYYWMAFLVANTLGTALGDYMADDLTLGFLSSAAVIGGLLVLCAILHYFTRISGIILFWLAFIMTRPFGATFGDFLTKNHSQGGVDIGTVGASAFFAIVLVIALWIEFKRWSNKSIASAF